MARKIGPAIRTNSVCALIGALTLRILEIYHPCGTECFIIWIRHAQGKLRIAVTLSDTVLSKRGER
jgi:hypothetical protein